MSIEAYLSYLVVVFVFFATPPDTSQLLIISNSLRYGVRKSTATIAGDLTANAIQMTAAAFGLAAAISVSAEFFQIIKWFGVAYLSYIGFRLMISKEGARASENNPNGRWFSLFRQGFVTSSANPFAIAFFAALFPQFINQEGNISYQLIILGGTYLLIDGAILILWGALAVRAFAKFKLMTSIWLNRICGAVMILAAIYLANNDLAEGHADN
jgi:homoserine/homoserine lactone efflux protein